MSHEKTFPKQWSRAQILPRLVELEGDEILQTPLKEIKVNQASRRKSEEASRGSGLDADGQQDHRGVLRLKILEKAAMITQGHPRDPVG